MTIKAIRMFDGGFISQPFAFGGEEGKEAFDDQMYYRNSLQNYAIDLGDEVILAGLSKAEWKGEPNLNALAQKLADMGIPEAAEEVKVFAEQERHHGEITQAILEKYAPEFAKPTEGVKKYVCPVCGFEYEGEIGAEPDDWKCPICGVGKAAFKPLD